MVLNIILVFFVTYGAYALILTNQFNMWVMWSLAIVMGLGMAGIGLGIMHDANHHAFSDKKWLNNFLGASLNLLGASKYVWDIRHNKLHHTFTNIYELDDDIAKIWGLRLSPDTKLMFIHRFQHLYVPLIYLNYTLAWLFWGDNLHIIKYNGKYGHGKEKSIPVLTYISYIFWKLFSLSIMILVPYLILDLQLWQIVVGFITAHWAMSIMVGWTFQLNHMMPGTIHGIPNQKNEIDEYWARYQVKTSFNFSMNNAFLTWYLGGLNFQVEHHLFPKISSIHYHKIRPIVEGISKKHNIPYNNAGSWFHAIYIHLKYLKYMGSKDSLA